MQHWITTLTKEGRYALMEWVLFFNLSRQVRALRNKAGWTQKELARRMGVAVITVNRLERWYGCRTTSITVLEKAAAAFDVALQVQLRCWSEWITLYITPKGSFTDYGLRPEALAVASFTEELDGGA